MNNNDVPITRWLIAMSKDGTLTMHELMIDETIIPTTRLVIACFNSALKVLVDTQDTSPSMTNYLGKIETSCPPYVYQLLVIGLGPNKASSVYHCKLHLLKIMPRKDC